MFTLMGAMMLVFGPGCEYGWGMAMRCVAFWQLVLLIIAVGGVVTGARCYLQHRFPTR